MKNFAVFISGFGSNLQTIAEFCHENEKVAKISVVISNKESVNGLKIAESFAIPSFVILNKKVALLNLSHLGKTKLIALPIANKKEGNTKSVGVKPCHLACNKGANVSAPSPGVFTMIIKQMVIPLKTSRDKNL